MSRDLDAGLAAAAGKAVVRPFLAALLDFAGGVVRATTRGHSVSFDGDGDTVAEDYLGVGRFGAASPVEEGVELQSYRVSLELSGVEPEMLALAMAEDYQGRPATLFYGLLDEDQALTGPPTQVFNGQMDVMEIERGAPSTITVELVDERADWERPRVRRWNGADHRARHPNDSFFDAVDRAVEREIIWGRKSPK